MFNTAAVPETFEVDGICYSRPRWWDSSDNSDNSLRRAVALNLFHILCEREGCLTAPAAGVPTRTCARCNVRWKGEPEHDYTCWMCGKADATFVGNADQPPKAILNILADEQEITE